jgi:small conductance mechanosensitive channel
MTFGISHSDDRDHVARVLSDIVTGHELILVEPAPDIRLHTLGESPVDFIVRPWARTRDYWTAHWDITRAVKKRFDEEGISIPFSQRDVHLIAGGSQHLALGDPEQPPKATRPTCASQPYA